MSEEENVGFFYNWYAVNDERGLAPEGFHVPDLEEMNKLLNFLSPDNQLDWQRNQHFCQLNIWGYES